MADKTKATTKEDPSKLYVPGGFDMSDFNESDNRVVGEFTPLWKPENADKSRIAKDGVFSLDSKGRPFFCGWAAFCNPLQLIEDEEEGNRVPLCAHFVLHKPSVGILGKRTEGETIKQLAGGDSLLLPMGGNLMFNREFMTALFDPVHVWYMTIALEAEKIPSKKSGRNDAWKFEVSINPKKFFRNEGKDPRFAMGVALTPEVLRTLKEKERKQLPPSAWMAPRATDVGGMTPTGHLYDANGEVRGRLVEGQKQPATA